MTLDDFVKRAEELVLQADQVLGTEKADQWGRILVDPGVFSGFRAASLSFLENLYGREHSFYTDFAARCSKNRLSQCRAGREIIAAVVSELRGGWLATARDLITAEIFSDFLEMASYLLTQSYKDAAAVITGSVLEEHLRQLCVKNGIATTHTTRGDVQPKKADTMNAELAKAAVYNKLDQKSVTAWLDLRNKAAHGKYDEYSKQQVEQVKSRVVCKSM